MPRPRSLQTVTLEMEFPWEWRDPDCHLWFFERGLPGYSWYVPKASGWLNVGIGAMAARLKERGETIRMHWDHLAAKMIRQFGITMPGAGRGKHAHTGDPPGYSYYVRGPIDGARRGNAYLTGDAAGLATRDLCEGIGPAIRSGHLAAAAILHGSAYDLAAITDSSLGGGLISRWMDWSFTRGLARA
jgi:flavin-dependent dehydrogenase